MQGSIRYHRSTICLDWECPECQVIQTTDAQPIADASPWQLLVDCEQCGDTYAIGREVTVTRANPR